MSDKREKVLFFCEKEPELTMVIKADSSIVVDGVVVRNKPQYARFIRGPWGGRYETDDPAIIDFIKQQPRFLEGRIVAVPESQLKSWQSQRTPEPSNERVMTGAVSTMDGPTSAPPAEGEPPQPVAAKVPVPQPGQSEGSDDGILEGEGKPAKPESMF